ncbi:MAG: S-methyl-5'-thioadenosine phosphorylase [Herpetosiphonaceae bacterium]|nr:S-methyl-5'-thioadenosine phosphorylase [Herpetosiphonaceae bacterium]
MAAAQIGVIGGSGLYDMPGLVDREEVQIATPFGDPSDRFVLGTLGDVCVAFLPRHGRGHRLLPSEVPSRANLHAFKQLGVERLLSVSAVGSLREELPPGRLVIPNQLVDRTRGSRPATFFGNGVVAHVQFDQPFCPELRVALKAAVEQRGLPVADRATYVVMEGPQFSTLAESEFHRAQGFDLIGMTALPEAKLAREAELCYATLALVTDYDCWHPQHDSVTVEAVIQVMHENTAHAQAVLAATIPTLGHARGCRCGQALQGAIMTAPALILPATRAKLSLLIDHRL